MAVLEKWVYHEPFYCHFFVIFRQLTYTEIGWGKWPLSSVLSTPADSCAVSQWRQLSGCV
jgi:hypothetical protein